jgi:DNA helicase-2/ATP-dependent DNA helicase PcrA
MTVGNGRSLALNANRGIGPAAVDCNVATDRNAEIAGIASTIQAHKVDGVAYRDQAVLCRSHSNLAKIALGLERAGIPVLYLGDLFERPEVRDLLALLSFAAEPHRGGLLRLATLPLYSAPLCDARALLLHAETRAQTPLAVLGQLDLVAGLTDDGRAAFARLAADIAGLGFKTGPGAFLCHLLFNRGALLRMHLGGDGAADQQRRLAIHQFLQFAIENDAPGDGDPKRRLLDWVRRLEVFGDERALREPPAAIDGIDAVRLMTVHASKGLEFKVVHLPALGAGMFPLSWRGERCPAPDGMLPTTPAEDQREDEPCLFCVALSRARNHLSLSRADRYSPKQGSNASTALKAIAAHLPRSPEGSPTWRDVLPGGHVDVDRDDLAVLAREHDGRDIDVYLGCPRRYLYQLVLGLSGGREDNGYVRFHRAVYRVLRWMGDQGIAIEIAAIQIQFEGAWTEIGPHDHPLEALYRGAAQGILGQAATRQRAGIRFSETLTATIDGHAISLPIDEIETVAGGFVVRRLRTGRPPKKADQRTLHALMDEAARQTIGRGGRFELQYLTTNEAVPITLAGVMDARLDETRGVLAGLGLGRFPATPKNAEDCPRCPHYFICPSVPE